MTTEQEIMSAVDDALFTYSIGRTAEITDTARFAHYTSAATAMSIIQGDHDGARHLWLRNATEMNDFSEVEWGQQCLGDVFRNEPLRTRFEAALNAINPALVGALANALLDEEKRIKASTYLMSLSLHDGAEVTRGKLSMWRAYGGDANVCMIFSPAPFLASQRAFELNISPVMYGGPEKFAEEFERVVGRIEANTATLSAMDPNLFLFNLKRALDFAVLSTKHEAFHEECEWRVIHRQGSGDGRAAPPSCVVNVGGIVQTIHRIPMRNDPENDVAGAELSEAMERIIIGPTPNPTLVRGAFVRLLGEAGVPDPEDRVTVSGIPLRR
jgi:hypothetical protein